MHFAYLPFFIHDAPMWVCVQDGRIKVGDRVLAVADEPLTGLSADKVGEHQRGPVGARRRRRRTPQGQTYSMIYESSL